MLDQLHLSLSRFANNCGKVIMLAGYFNLPDIDWTIPTIKKQCITSAIHNQLLNTLADHSLTQLNQTATRENNILDLVTTNSPNLVNRIEIIPGISDHHAIFTEVDTMPLVGKKQRTHHHSMEFVAILYSICTHPQPVQGRSVYLDAYHHSNCSLILHSSSNAHQHV